MLERLTRYDWTAYEEQEPGATRMPRLLRRYLIGAADVSRRALRAIWQVLASDDGIIMSPGLVALTAIATADALPDLDAEGRRRAARLLRDVGGDMWFNRYGGPDEVVVAAMRERLPLIRTLLDEDVPDTVGRAARLLRLLGERDRGVARRIITVFPREHHPGRRVRLVTALAYHGRRAFLPFLIDELADDPEPVVRWRAALAVANRLKEDTPHQEAERLIQVLLDAGEQERMKERVPAIGHVDHRTYAAVLLLDGPRLIGAMLRLLRAGGKFVASAVEQLLQRAGPWPTDAASLTATQKEVLSALVARLDVNPPAPGAILPWHQLLKRAGLPTSREGLRTLAGA